MMLQAAEPIAPATRFPWAAGERTLEFAFGDDAAVALAAIDGRELHRVPFVQAVTAGSGHVPASDRLVGTRIGAALRHVSHRAWVEPAGAGAAAEILEIVQSDGAIVATARLEARGGGIRATVTLRNEGERPLVLRSLASWAAGLPLAADGGDALAGWRLVSGRSDWLGEGRWGERPLREAGLVPLASDLTGHDPRGAHVVASAGTWSTGRELPMGLLCDRALAIAWQIEHNGSWRWEVGEDVDGGYWALSGPTDADASWTRVLRPGEEFTTVPVSVCLGSDLPGAVAALTAHRRALRRPHPDNAAMPVVFNDYMNTLDGDPTTERLLPLVDAAAEAGAEVFCIDAGWYDESGHWWDSVGEWLPSRTRFPRGLGEVVDAIRARGMVPGLWLEPEVVGVRSPMARLLPAEAFLQRHGERIVEHDRYHLDLRHEAAIGHLDAVVDRLVADFGIGFFKFDYNIDPGPGTDVATDSVGDGLLAHNRAHLAWLDRLLDRHPGLVVENCSSGAMRADAAMLSRLAMQSTSDQQDFVRYPPIAAAAPLLMLPEQAASWAYPQPGMDDEEHAFALVTGLLGRYYVSGYLNRMSAEQLRRVAAAIAAAKGLRAEIRTGRPHWPAGLPQWGAPWVALGLSGAGGDLVSLWRRGGDEQVVLRFPHLAGRRVRVETVFPLDLAPWRSAWDAASGVLTVHAGRAPVAARTLRLRVEG